MTFSNRLDEDIKLAMKAREKEKLEALRAAKTAFMLARTEKGAGSVLTEEEEMKILQRLVKQRRESAAIYKEQNREDLYAVEKNEAEILSSYLPTPLSDAQITAEVKRIISETGASGMQDMGKVMGLATKSLAGKADGKKISEIVRQLLG